MAGIFGDIFDFNNDGELNSFEQATEYMFLEEITKEDDDPWSDETDDWNDDETSDEDFELELAGLDRDDLDWMDEEERNKVLEEAGLDPDDYDF